MAEYPALPLWTDAYLADCSHLSEEEHGVNLRLLMLMWRTPGCRLPDDDKWLSHKLARSVDVIEQKYRPIISEFYQCEDGYITQKRLCEELEYLREQSKKNSRNARARWEGEKNKSLKNNENDICDRICENDAGSHNFGNAPTPTPTPTSESKKEKVKKENWISEEVWKAFVEMRQKIRKPLTAYSAKLVIGKLQKMRERGFDPNEALATAIENCWASVYEPRQAKYANASQAVPKRSPAEEREQRIVEKAIRVQAMLDGEKRNGTENALTIGKEERNYESD